MSNKYKSNKIMHSSDFTISTSEPNVNKITTRLVMKYKFSKMMSKTILLLIFLGFFSCIMAYFFKDGEDITLLAGILFIGGFASILLNVYLLIFFNQKRMDLQPFAYLIYQIKAIDCASIKEFVLPGKYNFSLLKEGIERLIKTNNVKGYFLIADSFITNNNHTLSLEYENKKMIKKSNKKYELPILDVLNKNIYRFKKLNIFLANHLFFIIIFFIIIFFIYIIAVVIIFNGSLRNYGSDILAMQIIFIPFFSFTFVLTFAYNIFIANASFKLDYYELIEKILSHDEINMKQLSINNIKEIPLLKYIIKQLIKTETLKNYFIEDDIIYKDKNNKHIKKYQN